IASVMASSDSGARVPIMALKGTIGHTLGAAGALETLAAAVAMERGVCPASVGEGGTEGGLAILDRAEPVSAIHTLKLSSAVGGANAALVLSKEEPAGRNLEAKVSAKIGISRAVAVVLSDVDSGRLAVRTRYPADRMARADDLVRLAMAAVARLEDEV